MQTIRISVFETNSSSTHSISISNDSSVLTSLTPDEDGDLVLEGGEFGWEEANYRDALTKANYCAVAANYSDTDVHYHINPTWKNMLIEVLKEQTGAKNVIFAFTSSYGDKSGRPLAYIDHQSIENGGAIADAFVDKQTLKNFIFNRNSVLTTDNDNH